MKRNFLPSASGKAFDFQDKSKTKWQRCFCITSPLLQPPLEAGLVSGSDWEQSPAICWDGRDFSRVIPVAGNRWTVSVPSLGSPAQGGDTKLAHLAPPGQGDPGWAAGAALDVGHCSTEDLPSIVPIWMGNDTLRALEELLC